jgi:hypothetical protein
VLSGIALPVIGITGALLLLLLFGCTTVTTGPSSHTPSIPDGVKLSWQESWCISGGERFRCVTLWKKDWDVLLNEREFLYRELKAACLALGHSERTCRTEQQSRFPAASAVVSAGSITLPVKRGAAGLARAFPSPVGSVE